MSESLTFDGELLTGPIACEDLTPLRDFAFRGSNRPMPGAAGQKPFPRVADQLDTTLTWFVTGTSEEDLEFNLEHYRAVFTTGADPSTGGHDVILEYAYSSFEGEVQVEDYAAVRTGPITATILTRLVVAAGALTAVPS